MEVMPYIWFGVAVIMAILEGVTYQLVSIWFVIGAIASTVVSIFLPEQFFVQLIVFIAVSLIALVVTRPIVKRITKVKSSPTNSDRYVGMTGVVKTRINNESSTGQVIVNGDVWSARSQDNSPIDEGIKVVIKDIKGVKLIVSPVKE